LIEQRSEIGGFIGITGEGISYGSLPLLTGEDKGEGEPN
jgi:hypothetical protein